MKQREKWENWNKRWVSGNERKEKTKGHDSSCPYTRKK